MESRLERRELWKKEEISSSTKEIAEFAGLRMSVTGSLIVHGCGMDMGFWLQNRVYQRACAKGYPNLFDPDNYKYLGKRRGYTYIK